MKIETRQQLEHHIKENEGKDVPLFSAFREFGFVTDDTIKSGSKIEIKKTANDYGPFIYVDGEAFKSLVDRHLDRKQNYNDTWFFTSQEEANQYARVK